MLKLPPTFIGMYTCIHITNSTHTHGQFNTNILGGRTFTKVLYDFLLIIGKRDIQCS